MTKVTSTCFRIIKTKKTSTKPSWNGISEELSNRSPPVNINTGGEIGKHCARENLTLSAGVVGAGGEKAQKLPAQVR